MASIEYNIFYDEGARTLTVSWTVGGRVNMDPNYDGRRQFTSIIGAVSRNFTITSGQRSVSFSHTLSNVNPNETYNIRGTTYYMNTDATTWSVDQSVDIYYTTPASSGSQSGSLIPGSGGYPDSGGESGGGTPSSGRVQIQPWDWNAYPAARDALAWYQPTNYFPSWTWDSLVAKVMQMRQCRYGAWNSIYATQYACEMHSNKILTATRWNALVSNLNNGGMYVMQGQQVLAYYFYNVVNSLNQDINNWNAGW